MNDLSILSLFMKLSGASITTYIILYGTLRIKFKIITFLQFLISPCLLFALYFLEFNITVYLLLCAGVLAFTLKVLFNTTYKSVIIPMLFCFCTYFLTLNIYSSALNQLNMLPLIMSNYIISMTVFGIIVPLTSTLLLIFLKEKFFKKIDLINIDFIDKKTYILISTFLLFGAGTAYYFSPFLGMISKNAYLLDSKVTVLTLNAFILLTLILIYTYIKIYFENHFINIKNKALQNNLDELKNLNKELRAKRHDFLNHLQVISGFIQLKKYHECFEYISGISTTCHDNSSIRTGLISINALLNSKQLRAKNKNVRMDFEISTQLDNSTFHVQDWEITNILGNLIDNAIYEETKVSTLDKFITVKINEYNDFYNFSVYNKNSYIPLEKKKNIFSSGYSTKGKDGHGMGLYIINNIVTKYNGYIELDSNIATGTNFSIYFPKQNLDTDCFLEKSSYPPQESLGTQTI